MLSATNIARSGEKPSFISNARYVFFKSFRSGIFFRDNGVEFGLRVFEFGHESVVPDVEGFERTSQPFLYQRCHSRRQGRSENLLKHLLHAFFRQLPVLIEAPGNQRGRIRRIRIGKLRSPIHFKPAQVARIRFRRVAGNSLAGSKVRILYRSRFDFVRERIPVQLRIINDGRGNHLRDDGFHHFGDHALFGQPILSP